MEKPFAPACERNQAPILEALSAALPGGPQRFLEIGSGTGQHGVHFTAHRPEWHWQCTDRTENLAGIGQWVAEAQCDRLPPPMALDVEQPTDWQAVAGDWNWIYTANTLHIMSWPTVQTLFRALPQALSASTGLVIYGPFNRGGRYTSESNAAFDRSLAQRGTGMGIRDLEAVSALAQDCGLREAEVLEMPANNLLLIFRPPAGAD